MNLWAPLRRYLAAVRDEPKVRAYLAGALIDDVGVAVSAWGMQLLKTDLFTDQRARAGIMLPLLCSFLLGSIVAGPLADWARRGSPEMLARWRWRLVVWGRVIETAALSLVIVGLANHRPSAGAVLPYFFIAAFMKTSLRPARIAFSVDLLRREEVQVDGDGAPMTDELGEPKLYKVHLLAFTSMTSVLSSVAALGGLIIGGRVLAAFHGSYSRLFEFDVITNLGFIAFVLFGCHPQKALREIKLRELFVDPDARASTTIRGEASTRGQWLAVVALREFGASVRDAVRFLRAPEQRPLCWLLFGAWIVEVVNEFYDGNMIVRHTLHGSDDAVRYGAIAWAAASILVVAILPLFARRVGSLGKIFLFTMFFDGVVMTLAGRVSALAHSAAIAPFIGLLALDRGLTESNGLFVNLAQNSASSAAMRGRIAATFAFVVILSDMAAEAASTVLSEKVGIPGMLTRVGVAQMTLMALVAVLGGARLWRFGLRSVERTSLTPSMPAVSTKAPAVAA